MPSTTKLTEYGLDVLRMGQFVEQPISSPNQNGVIDYASKYRSEFGDVWLLGNCKFAISGNGTGFYWISAAMNRPVVITDSASPCKTSYGKKDLYIPLLACSRENKMLMPFSWLISQGEAWATNRKLIEGDIEIVKNTAEEITEVVLEMNQRIDGTWVETDEDIELQERFRELRKAVPQWRVQQGVRIGAAFLRRYKHLL